MTDNPSLGMSAVELEATVKMKAELMEVIGQYHQCLVPLIVPIVLLRHHARRLREPYRGRQWYLNPYPAELMLRSHV